ncbi:hypothetical protein [Hymenobacter daeguensis]
MKILKHDVSGATSGEQLVALAFFHYKITFCQDQHRTIWLNPRLHRTNPAIFSPDEAGIAQLLIPLAGSAYPQAKRLKHQRCISKNTTIDCRLFLLARKLSRSCRLWCSS